MMQPLSHVQASATDFILGSSKGPMVLRNRGLTGPKPQRTFKSLLSCPQR